MRRALAAAAVFAALSGGPALAQDPTGYIGIFGGGGFSALGPVPIMGLEGAAAFRLGPIMVELETRGTAFFTAPVPSTIESGFAHGYWRDAGHAIGGFFGFEPTAFPGTVSGIWHFGGEGLVYLDRLTIYGQAAYLRINANGTVEPGWYIRAAARYFPRENVRLQVDLRYLNVASGLASQWTLAGTAEFQLPERPLSLVGTVRRTMGPIPATAVSVGLRVNFGHGTLAAQGTPMETMPVTF